MSEEGHGEEKEGGSHGGGGHGGGAHGGGGHEEAHEGAPEWLISFADNVALLMGFFVILLAMNMGPKPSPVQGGEPGQAGGVDPAMEAILGIREAFNSKLDSNDPKDRQLIDYKKKKESGLGDEHGIRGEHTKVQSIGNVEYKALVASVPFDDNSTLLSPSGRESLVQFANESRDQRWIIEVRGNVSPFEANHNDLRAADLCFERAKVVAEALVEAGLKWENLRLVSAGSYERVVARTYDRAEDRGNQRVEVMRTNATVQPDPYSRPKGGDEADKAEPARSEHESK